MRSLHCLVESIGNNRLHDLIHPPNNDSNTSPIANANLCDGLLLMRPYDRRGSLNISISWTRALPPASDLKTPDEVLLPEIYFTEVEWISRTLQSTTGKENKQFLGVVEALHGEPGGAGGMQGKVFLLVLHENELLRAQVELPSEFYSVAHQAHIENTPVQFEGRLRRGMRIASVENIESFHRLEQTASITSGA